MLTNSSKIETYMLPDGPWLCGPSIPIEVAFCTQRIQTMHYIIKILVTNI